MTDDRIFAGGVSGPERPVAVKADSDAPNSANPHPRPHSRFEGRERGERLPRAQYPENRPDPADIMRILEGVPDPEIPAISVVDLGIVRKVEWRGEELVVAITPTYTGCPATAVIGLEIEAALRARGLERVRVETRLAPPWTTDWISEQGRARLKSFGIAPPSMACAGATNAPSECPHCGSQRVERVSAFGSTPCKAQWRCAECREPFDYFKRF